MKKKKTKIILSEKAILAAANLAIKDGPSYFEEDLIDNILYGKNALFENIDDDTILNGDIPSKKTISDIIKKASFEAIIAKCADKAAEEIHIYFDDLKDSLKEEAGRLLDKEEEEKKLKQERTLKDKFNKSLSKEQEIMFKSIYGGEIK